MDWIDLAEDRDRWRALVITVRMLAELERPTAVQLLKNFPTFYGTEGSLPLLQEASTSPYPEPEQLVHITASNLSKIHNPCSVA
jgi:hypothetical protein